MLSTYWWRGRLEVAEETRVHFLTREALVPELAHFVEERHPYELPNVSAMRLTGGSPTFLQWIRDETKSPVRRGL